MSSAGYAVAVRTKKAMAANSLHQSLQKGKAMYDRGYLQGISKNFHPGEYRIFKTIETEAGLPIAVEGKSLVHTQLEKLGTFRLARPVDECIAINIRGSDTIKAVVRQVEKLIQQVKILNIIVDHEATRKTFEELIKQVSLDQLLLNKLTFVERSEPSLVNRLVALSLLSIRIGMALKLEHEQVFDLGMAALFSDLGLAFLPDVDNVGVVNLDENDQVEKIKAEHPLIGFYLLNSRQGLYSEEVQQAVLAHHECLDGSGFPQGLTASELGLYPRIISLSGAYMQEIGLLRHIFVDELDQFLLIEMALKKFQGDGCFDQTLVSIFESLFNPCCLRVPGLEIRNLAAALNQLYQENRFFLETGWDKAAMASANFRLRMYCTRITTIAKEINKWVIASGLVQLELSDLLNEDFDEICFYDDLQKILAELVKWIKDMIHLIGMIKNDQKLIFTDDDLDIFQVTLQGSKLEMVLQSMKKVLLDLSIT